MKDPRSPPLQRNLDAACVSQRVVGFEASLACQGDERNHLLRPIHVDERGGGDRLKEVDRDLRTQPACL